MRTVLKMFLALVQVRTGLELGRAGSHVSAAASFGGSMGMNFAAIDSICEGNAHLDDAGQVVGTAGWVGTWYATRAIASDDATDRRGFWALLAATYATAFVAGSQTPMKLVQRVSQVGTSMGLADIGRVQSLAQVRKLGFVSAGLAASAGVLSALRPSKARWATAKLLDIAAMVTAQQASQAVAQDVRTSRL